MPPRRWKGENKERFLIGFLLRLHLGKWQRRKRQGEGLGDTGTFLQSDLSSGGYGQSPVGCTPLSLPQQESVSLLLLRPSQSKIKWAITRADLNQHESVSIL